MDCQAEESVSTWLEAAGGGQGSGEEAIRESVTGGCDQAGGS